MDDFATSADLPDHAMKAADRVTAWLFLWDGMPKTGVARLLGVSDRTIYRWIDAWRIALDEPGLFKADVDPEQTAHMLAVRNERREEILAERDRLGMELVDTARMLNNTLQDAIMGEDFDVIEGLRQAITQAEEEGDDLTVRRLRHQHRRIVFSGGSEQLKTLATALGIITDKVIKIAQDVTPEGHGPGESWTDEDQRAYDAAMAEATGGSTHANQQPTSSTDDRR